MQFHLSSENINDQFLKEEKCNSPCQPFVHILWSYNYLITISILVFTSAFMENIYKYFSSSFIHIGPFCFE